jgi:peroxiredoxin
MKNYSIGNFKTLSVILLCVILGMANLIHAETSQGVKSSKEEEAESTLTQIGQTAPSFSVRTLNGDLFDVGVNRGTVVVINFFATWCPPCNAEVPHLEKEVWQKFKNQKFRMIGIAREETAEKIAPFARKYQLSYPLAADPKREIYSRFALKFIPRTYVIDADGKIVFQSSNFSLKEFNRMVEVIEALLKH